MPDIHALLRPRHVALIGASAVWRACAAASCTPWPAIPFRNRSIRLTRSHNEVMGRKAYASIQDLPEAPQLASADHPGPIYPGRSWSDADAPA